MNADEEARLRELGVKRLLAPNPGALTLSGTNTWVVGRDPAWVVDPGPSLPAHLDAIDAALAERGGLGGMVLTHHHVDHSQAVTAVRRRAPAQLAAGTGATDVELREGVHFGPFEAVYTPGHTSDHFALIYGRVCFTGDAVLGEGSVFISPEDPNALAGYLAGLARLQERELDVLLPGHGPPIWEPAARLSEYVEHRLERERRLVAALEEGRRSTADLLDAAWSDVPASLRPIAAITLKAHLDKLDGEDRLPDGIQ